MNDIEADSYQWDTPRDSKAPDLKPYAELVKALAEKDREIVKWSELIGSFTRSQHRYLVEMERLKQALAEKDLELELADFTIKESLEKIAAMDKKIQELEDWQKIVTGTGTDQEAVVRMTATEYTKVAVQCWKEKCEQQAQQIATLKSELSQRTNLEGSAPCWNSAHMKQIATLREALIGILEIGKRDMTNPKYDGYFEQAKQALEESKQ